MGNGGPLSEGAWRPNLRQLVSAALTMLRDNREMKRAGGKPVQYTSNGQSIQGTIYYPVEENAAPGVVLLHTASGLTPHEHAMAARLAREGCTVLVIAYSKRTTGAVIRDDAQRRQMEQITADGLRFLQADARVDANRTAVIGFSLGGYFALRLAAMSEGVPPKKAIVYYGVYPQAESLETGLRARVLILQGESDSADFVANAKKFRELARAQGKACELILYAAAGHQFDLFEAKSAAAQDAWRRTLLEIRD
jgi:dienelactone hydrolase